MANDDDMRRLMEQLLPCFYSSVVPNNANIVTKNLFVPSGCITKDFFQKIYVVLSVKKPIISRRWENFVAINRFKMASSYEVYLEYIMFACITETGFSDNVFDSILSACGLVIAFSIEAFEKTKVNFCELTVDIFMVFYKNSLKDQFCNSGGFEKLTGYLYHAHLKWVNFLQAVPENSNASSAGKGCSVKMWNNILQEELKKDVEHLDFVAYNDIRNSICHSLAKEVLLITKVKLSTFPSSDYLYSDRKQKMSALEESKKRIVASVKSETKLSISVSEVSSSVSAPEATASTTPSKREETANGLKTKTTAAASIPESTAAASIPESTIAASIPESTTSVLRRCSNTVTDSEENTVFENTTWCDNIVKAVINYNSKNPSVMNTNKRIQKVDEILGHLKGPIKSLIGVLENYDEK